jgi:heme A synthase
MELMNEQQHRNWTVILSSMLILSAVWAAWNRNAPVIVGNLGLALALALFYVARRSRRQQLLRWTAFACSIVSLAAMLFRSIILLLERNV